MTPEDLMRALALETGERLLAIDPERAIRQAYLASPEARQAAPAAASMTAAAQMNVAIIPLRGALRPRDMAQFRADLASAVQSADVAAIILDVDTPGGTVAGTPETAAAVAAAQAVKPVTAVVDTLCASAGYWISAQAGSVVIAPSADIGSIGVLAVHFDISQMLIQAGIRATITRSVPFKAEGNMLEPLSDEAKAALQADVDAMHADFVRAVAAGRKTSMAKVSSDFGQGRTLSAARAVAAGMADRIGGMADVIGGLRSRQTTRPSMRRRAFAF